MICLLHQNELPFRHLFELIDGKATGPESYTGSIGKKISGKDGLTLKPLAESYDFERIDGKVPIIDYELENNDLKYLYALCHLIQNGPTEGNLKILLEKPGKVNLSRWITTASNILRLYCQTKKPDMSYLKSRKRTRYNKATRHYLKLVQLVKIILNLYAPMCFLIRKNYHAADGSKLLFKQMQLAREILPKKQMETYKTVFKNNCFFAHPENVLLAMMFDNTIAMRLEAVEKILAARNRQKKAKTVRKFILPKKHIDFEATHYSRMIDWSKLKPREITEPPLLRKYSDNELRDFAEGTIELPKSEIPCHSQSVERMVYLTSKAASSEIGYTKRHSNILSKQKSYEKFPTKFKKSHFVSK